MDLVPAMHRTKGVIGSISGKACVLTENRTVRTRLYVVDSAILMPGERGIKTCSFGLLFSLPQKRYTELDLSYNFRL